MDTREKIVAVTEIGAVIGSGEWTIAVGQFDPLTAGQANRLSALKAQGGRLLAIVLEAQDALLPSSARVALIAALRDVDAVTVAEPERWLAFIGNQVKVRIVEDAAAEEARSADFVRFIVGKRGE